MSVSISQASPEDRAALQNSREAREVKRAAMALAKSQLSSDHQFLAGHLGTPSLAARLDPPEEATGSYQHLRLARVMRGLMENSNPTAQEAILRLPDTPAFNDQFRRIQILIRALTVIRPSPAQATQYWDKYSKPGSPVTYDVIEALCINQSPPALELLEQKCAEPGFTPSEKQVWMRESILVRRYDEPLIATCERILRGPLETNLKISLVEVLFDYRPKEWFIECSPPKPPELAAASEPARDILLRMGEYALASLALPEPLRSRVRSTVELLKESR
jgi:hypothetical protein